MVDTVILVDENGDSCPFRRASNKTQRIVRSSLSAEAMTLQDSMDKSLYIMLLDVIRGEGGAELPIEYVTDNISLKIAVSDSSTVAIFESAVGL